MTVQKQNLLVQLSVGDLQQLITDAVKQELQKITELFKLNGKDSKEESELLTRDETAKLLQVSTTTLFIWNRDSILKAKKMNSRVYYLRSDVMSKLKAVAQHILGGFSPLKTNKHIQLISVVKTSLGLLLSKN